MGTSRLAGKRKRILKPLFRLWDKYERVVGDPQRPLSCQEIIELDSLFAGAEIPDAAHRFLERYGRPWHPAPLPNSVPRGPENQCWNNARDLALAHSAWSYVEGVVPLPCKKGDVPIPHAWCVDEHGVVIDNTWPDALPQPQHYVGVPFDFVAVMGIWSRSRGYRGALFSVAERCPELVDDLVIALDPRWTTRDHAPSQPT
ncbi:MAG: hypothetical protein KGJ82_03660 [Nitrospirota bacterium]|nr:hypothetical protein [Nitrospirota bacterium]